MSLWRRIAIEKFPQLHRDIAKAENAGWVWYELRHALEKAYHAKPLDETFVGDVYSYASWCLSHRSIDIRTAVVLWFYEHLGDDDFVRADMARWVSQEEFDALDFAWTYVYKDNDQAFRDEFALRKAVARGVASKAQRNEIEKRDQARQAEVQRNSVFRRLP